MGEFFTFHKLALSSKNRYLLQPTPKLMPEPNPQFPLLVDPLSEKSIAEFLRRLGVTNISSGSKTLLRLGENPFIRPHLVGMWPYLEHSLATIGNPDRILASLDRLTGNIPLAIYTFSQLAENPRLLEIMLRIFAGSQFLTEILIKNPEYLSEMFAKYEPGQPKSSQELAEKAYLAVENSGSSGLHLNALRKFQRQELFRIGVCDLLGLLDLASVTNQLTYLADGLIQVSLCMVSSQLDQSTDGFVVISLGKLGGKELNYSSDIDLLFISRSDPSVFQRLSEKLIDAIACITEGGFLYRVDMRLRPWGSVGSLVFSLNGYTRYLENHARLWEKQALLKARPVAGDEELGLTFLRQVRQSMFGASEKDLRASILEMKLQTERALRNQGKDQGEVKLGQGSIRDIEFVIQFLQLTKGLGSPSILSQNTLDALRAIQQTGLLQQDEAHILRDGYIFLRTIEHYLQLNEYRQTHQLPSQPQALESLARRLGFSMEQASEDFLASYLQQTAAIRTVFLRYLGDHSMQPVDNHAKNLLDGKTTRLDQHLQRMDPSYATIFSPVEMQLHADMAASLDREHLVAVEANPLADGLWRVTIVAFDYLGELSLICGLMFVHGLNIIGGEVFTYEQAFAKPSDQTQAFIDPRKKIVDVFTVKPERTDFNPAVWEIYKQELSELLQLMDRDQKRLARGELAKRVATVMHETATKMTPLFPIEIEINNKLSEHYTVMFIESVDTIGFLYELTNALAYSQIYISRVVIDSAGNRVRDILYVSDNKDQKIVDPKKIRELRAAIVLIKHFTHLLPHSPNPVSALLHFREFLAQLFERPDWPDELTSLERPEVLNGLARLLGMSDFLWDDFLRLQYANLFPVVKDLDALDTVKSRQQLQSELEAGLTPIHSGPQTPDENAPWIMYVNQFKDREMFRIDMRHILGHTREFSEFSSELTDLAEVIVNSTYHLTAEDLRTVYGNPLLETGQISQVAVLALGKCGGRELGFASDIELMFVYEGNGLTSGPEIISSAEFHEKTVQNFIKAIHARREGIFEIDLQLRPYGKAGSLAVSLEAFKRYFAPGGPAWAYERQALVKLRPIAGDQELGVRVARLRDDYIYTGQAYDVAAMRAMRERQLRHNVPAGTFHPKFSPGGLVDVEYLVQALQMTFGHNLPELRQTNTRDAMRHLNEAGFLSDDDYTKLRRAHTFLRWLIDSLRVVRGNAKDMAIPPADSEEFAFLARRLRFGSDLDRLKNDLALHADNIIDINTRLLKS
jgi:glutamate-ammonia-ligase adenylyltransferase